MKIWNKNIKTTNASIDTFLSGEDIILDQELFLYDIEASIAHAEELKAIDILSATEFKKMVSALKKLNFKVIAAGDSYNDIGMLQEADAGILFCPPDNVIKEFPQFPVSRNYEEFKNTLLDMRVALNK